MPALLGSVMGSAVLRVAGLSAIFGFCSLPLAGAVAAIILLIPADLAAAELTVARVSDGTEAQISSDDADDAVHTKLVSNTY